MPIYTLGMYGESEEWAFGANINVMVVTNTFLDALIEERYHLTTSTILSLGSLRSAALCAVIKLINTCIILCVLINSYTIASTLYSLLHSHYLVSISGWAKNSAYISSSDRFSNIVTGSANLVKSIPIFSCDSIWRIKLFWVSTKWKYLSHTMSCIHLKGRFNNRYY